MNNLLKKITSSLSYIFGLLIFSTIFLLYVSQFEPLNLRPLSPVFNWYINGISSVYENSKITSLILKIDNTNNVITVNSNHKFWNHENVKWELNLKSEININLRFINYIEKFIDFKIITDSSYSNDDFQIKYFFFSGNLKEIEDNYNIYISGKAKDLPLDMIKDLWPNHLGKGAKEWTVSSLYNGLIKKLEFNSSIEISKKGYFNKDPEINLFFLFKDIDTYYLKNLPPITKTNGVGYLNYESFKIVLNEGIIELPNNLKIDINDSEFNAFDIKKRHGPSQVKILAKANTGDFFSLLSQHERVSKIINLSRDNLSGNGSLDLEFNFPLKKSIKFNETETDIKLLSEKIIIYTKDLKESVIGDSLELILNNHENKEGVFSGILKTDDLKIVELPIFAQILDLSIPGLSNIGDGGRDITFRNSLIDLELSYGGVNIIEAVMKPESNLPVIGNTLGLSLSGKYTFGERNINFDGTIVPISWLNNLPSNVPLLGELFSGSKEGEGLIGVKFRIHSDEDDKNIKIETNPLSVLTPGFLQRIFD